MVLVRDIHELIMYELVVKSKGRVTQTKSEFKAKRDALHYIGVPKICNDDTHLKYQYMFVAKVGHSSLVKDATII